MRLPREQALLTAVEIPGQTWYPELEWIYDNFGKSAVHLEIGTWAGRSMFATAQAMQAGSRLYSVDARPPLGNDNIPMSLLTQFAEAVARHCPEEVSVHMLTMTSLQAAAHFTDTLDSVFIDGHHAYDEVLADIESWLPKVRSGGIIAGHDYWSNHWGVMEAVNKVFNGKFDVVPRTRIWVARV